MNSKMKLFWIQTMGGRTAQMLNPFLWRKENEWALNLCK